METTTKNHNYKVGVNNFIVKVGEPHKRELTDENGKQVMGMNNIPLITSPKFDDWDNLKRQGEVIATVEDSGVPLGSTLHFSNIVTRVHDKYGENYQLEEGVFRVPYVFLDGIDHYQLAYAYQVGGDIFMLRNWVLLKPVKEKLEHKSGLHFVEKKKLKGTFVSGEEVNKDGEGIVSKISEHDLKECGFKEGDTVLFKEGQQETVVLNDTVYYKIFLDDITIKRIP